MLEPLVDPTKLVPRCPFGNASAFLPGLIETGDHKLLKETMWACFPRKNAACKLGGLTDLSLTGSNHATKHHRTGHGQHISIAASDEEPFADRTCRTTDGNTLIGPRVLANAAGAPQPQQHAAAPREGWYPAFHGRSGSPSCHRFPTV